MEKSSDDLLDEFEKEYSGPLHGFVADLFRKHSSDSTNSIAESIKTALKYEYQSRQEPESPKE